MTTIEGPMQGAQKVSREALLFNSGLPGSSIPAWIRHADGSETSAPLGFSHRLNIHFGDREALWDPSKLELYRAPGQEQGVRGCRVLSALFEGKKRVLGINVLYHLIAHPEIIPEDWLRALKAQELAIFFWGQLYSGRARDARSKERYLFVPCLHHIEGRLALGYIELHDELDQEGPALCWIG